MGVIVVADGTPESDVTGPPRLAALEHVANRPIAHHVIDALESAGVDEVIVVSPSDIAPDIRKALHTRERRTRVPIRYVDGPGPVTLSGALRLAAPSVGLAPCVVHLANGLLGEPISGLITRLDRQAPDVLLLVHQQEAPDEPLTPATRDMLHVADFDSQRAALGIAGVWLFGPGALERAANYGENGNGPVDLARLAEAITAESGDLQVLHTDAWRRYRGDPVDLLELNRLALDQLDPGPRTTGNYGNQIEGRVRIDERASVSNSVIVGPVIIGPEARVADAYIGPYTSVGAGAHIEGAEIERSIIADGASITHVGGRLVASVVGRDARIFRDFSVPRALRIRVGDGTVVSLC